MLKRTSISLLSHSRRTASVAILSGLIGLAGCTGETGPEPISASTPTAATPADAKTDAVPTVPGGKRDLMDGIPKK